EKFPTRGFMSSMETPLIVAKDGWATADSILLIWPDNTFEYITHRNPSDVSITYRHLLPKFDYNSLLRSDISKLTVQDLTNYSKLNFAHRENPFVEFNREPLIPHAVSNEGPAIASADVNGDNLDDIYLGNAKWEKSELWIQNSNNTFYKSDQKSISSDSTYEDTDATFADLNNDGFTDLIVASGGNEFSGNSEFLLPRVYMNDGKGNFLKNTSSIQNVYTTASCVLAYDFSGDGYADLFIGSRAVPWKYGEIPKSYFLKNDGQGNFMDVTDAYSLDDGKLGLITSGQWADMDGDGSKDLVLSVEWDRVMILINKKGKFDRINVGNESGWWKFIHVIDVDNDGDKDIVAGNFGQNSRLKATDKEPITMYYNDFDQNDTKEQLVTYYLKGKETPVANIVELHKQIPVLKKSFLKATDFAKATIPELFPNADWKNMTKFKVNYLMSCVFINDGNLKFTVKPLPTRAQLSTFLTATSADLNGDSLPDLILGGNYYENNVQQGRSDGDYCSFLINKGKGNFEFIEHEGLQIKGQVRKIVPINGGSNNRFVVGRNNEPVLLIECKDVNN
ncbi:MAG: FG-GAP-like repeat-containing protein, partial [Saprospiraceae bacterium]